MKTLLLLTVVGACVFGQGNRKTPFACDRMALDAKARHRHFDELGPALRSMKKTIRELPDGFEFQFPSDANAVQLLAEWVAGEHACCPFFDIELRLDGSTALSGCV